MITTMTSLTTRATVLCEMQLALSMVIWIPIGIQIQIKVPCDRGHVQFLLCTGGLSCHAGRGSYAWSCVHGEDPLPKYHCKGMYVYHHGHWTFIYIH